MAGQALKPDASLSAIASYIVGCWPYPDPRAVPYVDAMLTMETLTDTCDGRSGEAVVRGFLARSAGWKGRAALRARTALARMLRESGEDDHGQAEDPR